MDQQTVEPPELPEPVVPLIFLYKNYDEMINMFLLNYFDVQPQGAKFTQ